MTKESAFKVIDKLCAEENCSCDILHPCREELRTTGYDDKTMNKNKDGNRKETDTKQRTRQSKNIV